MFPWSPEFAWDAGHLAFFGAFYSVLAAIGAVLWLGLRRAGADARSGRAHRIAWHATFEELPARDRACRHQLTGEAPGRLCDNAFDCRRCSAHPAFESLRAGRGTAPISAPAGLQFPADRLYHRGHVFAKPEPDGTVTIGLDDLARRLVGAAEVVRRPQAGARLEHDAPALRLRTRGSEVRLLSPVAGVVLGTSGDGAEVTVRVDPGGSPLDVRHLLAGEELGPWAMREVERLQALLGTRDLGPALADGGELLPDLGGVIPRGSVDGVLGEMLLDL